MSYILDALRRAESERQRGQLPGLGALPLPPSDAAAKSTHPALRWGAIGLVVLAVVIAMVGWLRQPASVPATVVPAAAAPLPAATAASETASAPSASTPNVIADANAIANASVVPAVPAPGPLPKVVSAPPAAAPVSVPTDAPQDKGVLKLSELTPQQRSEWPALGVGGSVWSDSPASRFVILNGQVLREGQTVSPGLTLERIQPRAVQLRWRGLLVEVPL